ncbi:MAG: quinol:cytochrome C oxidoreductase [Blastocatellia bacterium]|nr:MAG: quinol:cytochrome C oxidoreductase [Blastocatellia bacterium]
MRTRRSHVCTVLFLTAGVAAGCNQMMNDEPRYKPLAASDFFADGQSARPQVEGTIARGHLHLNDAYYTGKSDGVLVSALPVPLTHDLLARGQERFDIFCSPCHGRLGNGNGVVVERGFRSPPSYHIDRLRTAPIGHFFDVMTNGFGAMSSYASRVPPADRWAIASYVRALQLSQHATLSDAPTNVRQNLLGSPK